MEAIRIKLTIENRLGLHARPAMSFVDAASQFKSDIKVIKDGQAVDGKSIMQLLTLMVPTGTQLEIAAEGPDAEQAINALQKLVESKFDED